MSYSSIHTLSSGRISPHSLFHCMPTPWRHILSAIFSHRKGSFICPHIFLAIMLVLVWYSTVVSSCLFGQNNFVIICVSHTLFSNVCCVHDQGSFSKSDNDIHVIHQALTFHSPRNILALVYLDVLSKSFVCRLRTFFYSVARFLLTIHHTSQCPEFDGNLKYPVEVPRIISSFSSEAHVLVHHRLTGLAPNPLSPLLRRGF